MRGNVTIGGMTLVQRGDRSPEQYEVTSKDGKMLAYMKVRGGRFHVECPDVGGTLVYEAFTNGKGCLIGDERMLHLTEAVRAVKLFYEQKVEKNSWFCKEDNLPERERLVLDAHRKEDICRGLQKKGRWVEKRDQTVTYKSGFEFETPEDEDKYLDSCREYMMAVRNLQDLVDKEVKEENEKRRET